MALLCIHHVNRVNSRNVLGHDDSTIKIVLGIIIIIIIIIIIVVGTFGQQLRYTHVAVLVGETTALHCNHDCNDIYWWLNSEIIVASGQLVERYNYTERFAFSCDDIDEYYDFDMISSVSGSSNLTIVSAQIEDSGHYLCGSYSSSIASSYSKVTVIRKLRVVVINLL